MSDEHEQQDPSEQPTRAMRPAQRPPQQAQQTQPHQPQQPPPQSPAPAPKKSGGMSAQQLRIVGVAWVLFTLVAGIGAFFVILWVVGGSSNNGPVASGNPGEAGDLFATPVGGAGGGGEALAPTALPTVIAPTEAPAAEEPAPDDPAPVALPDINAFAFGGQEPHGGFPHMEAMQGAGMTWVKLQAGDLTTDFGLAIDNAHNSGMRILISVADKTNKDRILDPAYQEELFVFMETLARQGADAIEVWNEPNIDREWPTGQISGASYAALLQSAYTRIKAVNPDTIVISGAPAPTGFFGGACTPEGCDDQPYLREMVAAGALDYMDCVGIHYNEGILPPTAASGDPRGNSGHYTRYYPTMVETYREATNYAKPLCFTELGYLAGAENPNLGTESPGFAWAASTSLQNQADWLAQALQLSRDSNGAVRMMIVFNVGLTTTGADPQAYYAIVRPDGSCPACTTMGAVMGQ